MSKPYLEISGFDNEGNLRKTGMILKKSPVKKVFEGLKSFAVEREKSDFVIDYYDSNHDLKDSIFITARTFVKITGKTPPTSDELIKFDEECWEAWNQKRKEIENE